MMVAVRKETQAFADLNNRDLLSVSNPHLLVFARYEHEHPENKVLVVANFDNSPQSVYLSEVTQQSYFNFGEARDLYTGEKPEIHHDVLVIPANKFYWLSAQ